jgi:hypothetical protein
VLAFLDAGVAERLVAHHVGELNMTATGLTLIATGWLDASASRALLELAVWLSERTAEVVDRAAQARARADGHGDAARALAALRSTWEAEARDWQAAMDRSGRRVGWALLAVILLLAMAVLAVVLTR